MLSVIYKISSKPAQLALVFRSTNKKGIILHVRTRVTQSDNPINLACLLSCVALPVWQVS